MNTITITFTHARASSPKYTFGERVAIKSNGEPQEWATGRVTGLRFDDYSTNTWNYTVVLDYPQVTAKNWLRRIWQQKMQFSTNNRRGDKPICKGASQFCRLIMTLKHIQNG